MTPRTLTALTAIALLGGLTACGDEPADPPPAVEVDTPDCDGEDRLRREVPDCGYRNAQGRFVWWDWARAGKTAPPPGWVTPPTPHAPKATPKVTPRTSKPTTRKPTVRPTPRRTR